MSGADGAIGPGAAPSPRARIDRRAPEPLYHQLKQALLASIEAQGLEPGDQLPTEQDLERDYGVSRATIRQAVNDLVADGIVERIQGKGTFIAARRFRHVATLSSFAEDLASQGHVASRTVLGSGTRPAPPRVAGELRIEEGAACGYLQRIMRSDDVAIGLAETWLPMVALGGHGDALERLGDGSLYELLQSPPISLRLVRGSESVSSQPADADCARLLGCVEGSPALVVERIAYDGNDRPVEWTRTVFPGERYEYRIDIGRPGRLPLP